MYATHRLIMMYLCAKLFKNILLEKKVTAWTRSDGRTHTHTHAQTLTRQLWQLYRAYRKRARQWWNTHWPSPFYFKGKITLCFHQKFIKINQITTIQEKCKAYPCERCLNSFHTKERLNQHSKYCSNHKSTIINLPKAGSNI